MRLGQLARKLAIRPSQIVDFLANRQIFLEEGSNAKLKDDSVKEIVHHFAPEKLQEIVVDLQSEIEPVAKETEPIVVNIEPVLEETPTEDVILPFLQEEKPEVIKASKVELSGLKVLGKIDLPVPKKKEPETSSPEDQPVPEREERSPRRERKKLQTQINRETVQRPWKNPIAQQREKEVREQEEKKRAALAREKERKREHYFKKVKVGQPTKAARLYEETIEETPLQQETQPKTLWGKFIKWLNN